MKPTITPSLSTLVQVSTSSATRLDLSNPRLIEAVVLSNSPLLNPSSSKSTGQFTIQLKSTQQSFEIITDKPIPKDSQLTINITKNGSLEIKSILPPSIKTQTTPPPSTSQAPLISKEQLLIDNLLRQALPQKQPIKQLLPLLKLVATQFNNPQTAQQVPKELVLTVTRLIASFPSPDNLQQPTDIKKAILNNGTFLEAKLAQGAREAKPDVNVARSALSSNSLNQDIKAQIQQLAKQVEQMVQPKVPVRDNPSASAVLANTATSPTTKATTSEALPASQTAANPLTAQSIPLAPQGSMPLETAPVKTDNLDIMLKQLSRQLLSSLAQTQTHQAETLSARGAPAADGQAPVNNWTLEIPIFNGKQIDNIDLLIKRESANDEQDPNALQWTIMLNFDLHALGKLNVQLSVVNQSVSATVWSEAEKTHQTVRQHVSQLQENFEKVGVHVKRIECLHGTPPDEQQPVQQRLVDTHS